jgi:hypothetical protein
LESKKRAEGKLVEIKTEVFIGPLSKRIPKRLRTLELQPQTKKKKRKKKEGKSHKLMGSDLTTNHILTLDTLILLIQLTKRNRFLYCLK